MECHIRPATSRDAVAISRVVIAALRESNSQGYPPDVIAQVEQSLTIRMWKRRISTETPCRFSEWPGCEND